MSTIVNPEQPKEDEKVRQEHIDTAKEVLNIPNPAETISSSITIPKISVKDLLAKSTGLSDEELNSLMNADSSMIFETVLGTLKSNFWGLLATLSTLIPGFGAEILAFFKIKDKFVDLQQEIAKKIVEKIEVIKEAQANISVPTVQAQVIPKYDEILPSATPSATPSAQLVRRGGSHVKRSYKILKRLEKSKKLFYNTNKMGKSRKIGKSNKNNKGKNANKNYRKVTSKHR